MLYSHMLPVSPIGESKFGLEIFSPLRYNFAVAA